MRRFLVAGLVLALAATGGCLRAYKLEVQQGNIVTPEMIDKLKPGMTKTQVRFVLGTPLIADPFHAERWDYVYLYKKSASAPGETRRLTVIFNGDQMLRTEGDLAKAPSQTGSEPSTVTRGSGDNSLNTPAAESDPSTTPRGS